MVDKYHQLKQVIGQIYHHHHGRYGYRRILLALRHMGHQINHKTVQKLMQQLGLASTVRPKRYRAYKGHVGAVAPNLLDRQFEATAPHQKWVTDITEFNIRGQKLYLSPILDLYNREVIAYTVKERPQIRAVIEMLEQARRQLKTMSRPVLHSDQGWQYQMRVYQQALADHGIRQSMSRKGNCLDNAAIESFFAVLKTELLHKSKFESVEVFKSALHEYIHYYNHERIKQKLKGLSPVQFRLQSFG